MNLYRMLGIVGTGIIVSMLFILMIYLAYAQFLLDFVLNNLSNSTNILVIILGLFGITIVVSLISGFLINKEMKNIVIFKASILSLLTTVFILFIISYVAAFLQYRFVFEELQIWEIILVFPQILVYFAIYTLDNFFMLFVLFNFIYFIIYSIFLQAFHEVR